MLYFNSRPHKEVDLLRNKFVKNHIIISTHDLTRRSTREYRHREKLLSFQLTTSQGGRRFVSFFLIRESYFNSRPHKEVDFNRCDWWIWLGISTHDLTRRSTLFSDFISLSQSISTHDLTRRSTTLPFIGTMRLSSISTHDLTRRSTTTAIFYFKTLSISTHDLTRRSTFIPQKGDRPIKFQLTTSQGGRHVGEGVSSPIINISTHDLTRRSTLIWL